MFLQAWRAFSLGEPAATVADLALRAVDDGRIFDAQLPLHAASTVPYLLVCTDELDAAERAIDQFAAAADSSGSMPAIAAARGWRGGLPRLAGTSRAPSPTAERQSRRSVTPGSC